MENFFKFNSHPDLTPDEPKRAKIWELINVFIHRKIILKTEH